MISPTIGNPVTVTLNTNNYHSNKFGVEVGMKLFLDKKMLPRQKVKNGETVCRLLNKKYKPYTKVREVKNEYGESTIKCGGIYN